MDAQRETRETEVPPQDAAADGDTERQPAAPDEASGTGTDPERRGDTEGDGRAEEYLSLLKRERADFTNYRRRMEQERGEQAQIAIADLVLSLLPALDDFERALTEVPPDATQAPWVEGVRLIDRSLRAALERAGLERVSTVGRPFDPRVHEVLLQEDAPDRPVGEVVRELRAGYRLGDRVLRPAQVAVARGG